MTDDERERPRTDPVDLGPQIRAAAPQPRTVPDAVALFRAGRRRRSVRRQAVVAVSSVAVVLLVFGGSAVLQRGDSGIGTADGPVVSSSTAAQPPPPASESSSPPATPPAPAPPSSAVQPPAPAPESSPPPPTPSTPSTAVRPPAPAPESSPPPPTRSPLVDPLADAPPGSQLSVLSVRALGFDVRTDPPTSAVEVRAGAVVSLAVRVASGAGACTGAVAVTLSSAVLSLPGWPEHGPARQLVAREVSSSGATHYELAVTVPADVVPGEFVLAAQCQVLIEDVSDDLGVSDDFVAVGYERVVVR